MEKKKHVKTIVLVLRVPANKTAKITFYCNIVNYF